MASLFDISASGMTAERFRMDITANNVANANTTRQPDGSPVPYKRQTVISSPRKTFSNYLDAFRRHEIPPAGGDGVKIDSVVSDPSPPKMVFEPGHPDADPETGLVAMPNVNVVSEMVDLISASRAYEANVTVFNESKNIMARALDIGRG
jgi:flagellar basal-body rod protein FlgC